MLTFFHLIWENIGHCFFNCFAASLFSSLLLGHHLYIYCLICLHSIAWCFLTGHQVFVHLFKSFLISLLQFRSIFTTWSGRVQCLPCQHLCVRNLCTHAAASVACERSFPMFAPFQLSQQVLCTCHWSLGRHSLFLLLSCPLRCVDCWSPCNWSRVWTNWWLSSVRLHILITCLSSDYCKELAKYGKV